MECYFSEFMSAHRSTKNKNKSRRARQKANRLGAVTPRRQKPAPARRRLQMARLTHPGRKVDINFEPDGNGGIMRTINDLANYAQAAHSAHKHIKKEYPSTYDATVNAIKKMFGYDQVKAEKHIMHEIRERMHWVGKRKAATSSFGKARVGVTQSYYGMATNLSRSMGSEEPPLVLNNQTENPIHTITNTANYSVTSFLLNPTNPDLFPITSNFAKFYEHFRFKGITIIYTPSVGADTPGQVGLMYDPDATDNQPASMLEMIQNPGSSVSAVWAPQVVHIPAKYFDAHHTSAMWTNPDTASRLANAGIIHIVTQGGDGSSPAGFLSIRFDLELNVRQMHGATPYLRLTNSAFNVATPLKNALAAKTSTALNLGWSWDDTKITMPPYTRGKYLLIVSYSGTTSATLTSGADATNKFINLANHTVFNTSGVATSVVRPKDGTVASAADAPTDKSAIVYIQDFHGTGAEDPASVEIARLASVVGTAHLDLIVIPFPIQVHGLTGRHVCVKRRVVMDGETTTLTSTEEQLTLQRYALDEKRGGYVKEGKAPAPQCAPADMPVYESIAALMREEAKAGRDVKKEWEDWKRMKAQLASGSIPPEWQRTATEGAQSRPTTERERERAERSNITTPLPTRPVYTGPASTSRYA